MLSFKIKFVGSGPTCQSLDLKFLSDSVFIFWIFSFCFLSFKFKVVGGGPTASNFFYSLRSPYGTPFRRAANYAVNSKKSNQKMP